ncbi:MAG TPA: EcsC family protein [Bacillales bacterium]|nr:EcsC family protein [Bacillales bacterium]
MGWTERDEQVWKRIEAWEDTYFTYEPNDIAFTYEHWLGAGFDRLSAPVRKKVPQTIDTLLFHLHALIQNAQFQAEAKERLLNEARLFRPGVNHIGDMKKLDIDQLRYMASQNIARQRLISFAQGGLTGTGGFFLLGIDFPAVLAINLRSVQLIAMNYGYEVALPAEMMTSLKVFHTASLPKRLRGEAWRELEDEVFAQTYDPYFYEDDHLLVNAHWMEHTLKQLVKSVVIQLLRKKVVQGVPLLGMAFGAGVNYQFSRRISELAHYFYQKRYLYEKKQAEADE